MLGGVETDDATGEVISAKAAIFRFYGMMNGTAAREEGVSIEAAIGTYVRIICAPKNLCAVHCNSRTLKG